MQTLSATLTALVNPKVLVTMLSVGITLVLLVASFSLISSATASGAGGSVEVDGAYIELGLQGEDASEAAAIRKLLDF